MTNASAADSKRLAAELAGFVVAAWPEIAVGPAPALEEVARVFRRRLGRRLETSAYRDRRDGRPREARRALRAAAALMADDDDRTGVEGQA